MNELESMLNALETWLASIYNAIVQPAPSASQHTQTNSAASQPIASMPPDASNSYVAVFPGANPTYQNISYSNMSQYVRFFVYNGKAYNMGSSSDAWAQANGIPIVTPPYQTDIPDSVAIWAQTPGITMLGGTSVSGDQAARVLGI
jgi:hypothetical protein